jgi:hypothetical protein
MPSPYHRSKPGSTQGCLIVVKDSLKGRVLVPQTLVGISVEEDGIRLITSNSTFSHVRPLILSQCLRN